jgi:putative membrane protein
MTEYPLLNGLLYCLLGVLLFVVSFTLVMKVFPLDLWKQLVEERNIAVAIFAAAFVLGLCWMIAATLH